MSKTYNRPLQHDEYIRLKYLSGTVNEEQEKAKKRRAIKAATKHKKIKIVDDDIDLKNLNCEINDDNDDLYYGTKEEKPVIAAIIDERPMHLKRKDTKSKWITIADGEVDEKKQSKEISKPISSTIKKRNLNEVKLKSSRNIEKDLSPPRLPQDTERQAQGEDLSPPRARAVASSPRREKRSRKSDDDLSPPRAIVNALSATREKRARNSDDDLSPPRHKHTSDRDLSPSRQKRTRNSDDDLSPPRIKSESTAAKRITEKVDDDLSPIRNSHRTRERSPHSSRRHRSPKHRRSYSRDREKRSSRNDNHHHHRSRRNDLNSKRSVSPRNSSHRLDHDHHQVEQSKDSTEKSSKHSKNTSNERDRHGLWDAKSVREEAKRAREKEKQAIAQVATEISGKNAKTVVRDRTTGKIRDLEAEAKLASEKSEEEERKLAKYKDWNVGVKQREEQKAKVEETLHEFTKPLARYADDDDLDKLLREREQIDDPMLQYMREKKAKEKIAQANERGEKILEKPKYKGPPAPLNRFNIQPGYRWDGVDRSNGFERSFFSRQAEKSAIREEAYRWSTEDM